MLEGNISNPNANLIWLRCFNGGTAAAIFDPISKARVTEVHELNAHASFCLLCAVRLKTPRSE